VKASENKSFYDEPLAEYAFEIRKPLWQTAWFILLATILTVGLIYLFMKNREKRLRRIEELDKEKVESQLRALKAQINPHFLFNSFNTLITIIDENSGNPEIPIEYVQKLADFYRSILQYREEDAISVPEEVELVKNYYYLLRHRYGDNLILQVDMNGMQGYIPPLTLQMLVENAVKHNIISKSKPLIITIRNEGEEYVVVENNLQRKLSDAPSTKFGLQNIVNRYELISHKKVLIEETKEMFKVSIPVIKKN
jgi:LytS/YehU family sensor histidine kinase